MWFGLIGLVLAEPYFLQWEEPTQREDGTPLPLEQILAYWIFLDGSYLTFAWGGETSKVIEVDTSGPHIVTMKTLDANIKISAPSNGVGIPLTPPVAPGICVSQ